MSIASTDDDLATRRTRRVDDPGQGVDQQLGAQATAVERLGQCQLREQDRGDLTRGSASELRAAMDQTSMLEFALDGPGRVVASLDESRWTPLSPGGADAGQQYWMSLSSNARLVPVENTSHNIQIDRPEIVIEEIQRLLP